MIQIRIPNYLRSIQLSNGRRPKLFTEKTCPKKYLGNDRYEFRVTKHWGKNICALFDKEEKEFVVANANLLDKPRYMAINGNVILRTHSDILVNKVFPQLTAMFTKALQAQCDLKVIEKTPFPWKTSIEFRTHYGQADWDIDNPWVYEKCFNDALKKFIGVDDSILKITNGGEKKFRPIRSLQEPELLITIQTDDGFKIERNGIGPIRLEESNLGEPGEIEYSYYNERAIIFTGKKKPLYGAAHKAIRKVMFKCLNDLVDAEIPRELYFKYQKFFDEFKNYNVQTIIK